MQDAEALIQAGDLFETLMGADVARRRQFLLDHSELVDREILDI
jgi:DNA gyrase subunit B